MAKAGSKTDILIVGGGLSGLAAALALGGSVEKVVNVAPLAAGADHRTTALLNSSLEFLDSLGIGAAIRRAGAPLATMRIVDDTRRLIHAPQVNFHASEIGLEAFGYNIANGKLAEILRPAVAAAGIAFVDASLEAIREAEGAWTAELSNGEIVAADLIVGADGRNSAVRGFANIAARTWQYPQVAIVLNVGHQYPHDDASTEFHTPSGPFTVVPLGPKTASLVWVESAARATQISAMQPGELEMTIERKMYSMLGRIEALLPLQTFPLTGMVARRFAKGRIVLVGDAAHVLPPIGAQGFNLGIRDIQTLGELVRSSTVADRSGVAETYHLRRLVDVTGRISAIDIMNRSLLADFLPVQLARSIGFEALRTIPPLRRFAMREGIAPNLRPGRISDRISALIGSVVAKSRG
jgi:2-octaprenyl-6-methoxyphenol hydroxylase